MRHTLYIIKLLQGLQEDSPGCRLARPTGPNHHQAMIQITDRVQLEHLLQPQIVLAASTLAHVAVIDQMLLAAHLLDLVLQAGDLHRFVLDSWEDVVEEGLQQWQVLTDQTRYEGFHD